jgi:hypothetical protein
MIYSGLTERQVHKLEQKFVDVVTREFDDPQEVITDPSLAGDEAYYGRINRNENLQEDSRSDPEDEAAVREHQRRVMMFDFYHDERTAKCEVCGVGQGTFKKRRRDKGGFFLV